MDLEARKAGKDIMIVVANESPLPNMKLGMWLPYDWNRVYLADSIIQETVPWVTKYGR